MERGVGSARSACQKIEWIVVAIYRFPVCVWQCIDIRGFIERDEFAIQEIDILRDLRLVVAKQRC